MSTRQVYRVLYVCDGCGESIVKYYKPRRIVFSLAACTCGSVARFQDGRHITIKDGGLASRLSHA